MPYTINKNVDDKTLTVEVVFSIRKFASHQIKVLTTNELIDILVKEHKFDILKTIKQPSHRVGNSRRQKIKPSGLWVFEIALEQEKPKPKRTRKTPKKPALKTNPSKIRDRMSTLAKNKTKEEEVD